MNINAEFFNIIRERSVQAMSRFWLNVDYVKCIHASGELFTGYVPCYLFIVIWKYFICYVARVQLVLRRAF